MFSLPHITRVCCMTSETFAKVWGILGLMGSCLAVAITGTIYGLYHDKFKYDLNLEEHSAEVTKGIFAVLILFFLFYVCLCWTLLYGIHKGRSIYMLPWLIVDAFTTIVSILDSK